MEKLVLAGTIAVAIGACSHVPPELNLVAEQVVRDECNLDPETRTKSLDSINKAVAPHRMLLACGGPAK